MLEADEQVTESLLIQYLNIRRRCLQKFLDFSKTFQIEIEMKDLVINDIRVDHFISRRNSIMKILFNNDSRINDILKSNNGSIAVKAELKKQCDLIIEVQKIDKFIMNKIIIINNILQNEMLNFEKNEIKIKKFKSKWVATSGDRLDGVL